MFLWSDAWLLQAIILASGNGPATLAQIIGAADAVNHALLTDDELHGGLTRLTTGGFVAETEERFVTTELVPATAIASIRESGWKKGRRVATEFLDAEEWTPERSVRDSRNRVLYAGLTRERIHAAEQEYRRRIKTSGPRKPRFS